MTDLSAAAGSVVWLALVGAVRSGTVGLTAVELYVALAALVLVPLGLGLLEPARDATAGTAPYTAAVVGQFPAALAVVAGLAAPQGSLVAVALVVPWLGVTGSIALLGVQRLVTRRGGPLHELAIDTACLYVPVAAVFLSLHAAGISLRFAPIIVLLTAVHFHYAGFALPLVVGLAGRIVAAEDGRVETTVADHVAAASTVVIVVGIVLVAVGITFSPLIEVVAVAVFTAGVIGFASVLLREVVPAVPRLPGMLLALAALSVFWTMALALAFAYSSLPGTQVLVTIPEMVRWHGSVNAFGFALPALLAFRLLQKS
ncbi:YndJ family transporter [Natronococcus pandeyae]|uniref:YndJ family transporter n=1 Tax=Natronococcus pandeyae TaxID=2055836 RepID=UPI001F29D63C|nr:YndJ family transporter [Natronococcus pandeyae]